jgi:ABC-type transporter Mla subunit MlaD
MKKALNLLKGNNLILIIIVVIVAALIFFFVSQNIQNTTPAGAGTQITVPSTAVGSLNSATAE